MPVDELRLVGVGTQLRQQRAALTQGVEAHRQQFQTFDELDSRRLMLRHPPAVVLALAAACLTEWILRGYIFSTLREQLSWVHAGGVAAMLFVLPSLLGAEVEPALLEALSVAGLDYTHNPGEGAFYGPKLEFVLRDAIGRRTLANAIGGPARSGGGAKPGSRQRTCGPPIFSTCRNASL